MWKAEMVIVLIDTKLKTILGKRRKLIMKYPDYEELVMVTGLSKRLIGF
jgi:hypothetical protein